MNTLKMLFVFLIVIVKLVVSFPIHYSQDELDKEYAKLDQEMEGVPPEGREKKLSEKVVMSRLETKDEIKKQGRLETEKKQLEEDLADSNLPAAIRGKIEFWEDILAPNYKFKGTLSSNLACVNYHQEKWVHILKNNVNDPAVIKILDFLNRRSITIDTFATRIAGFFSYTSNKIHFKQVEKLSEQEIETILKDSYGVQDPLIIDLAIFLTKKL